MRIAVFGLGYVGTVTAAALASQGHQVWGVDVDDVKVDGVLSVAVYRELLHPRILKRDETLEAEDLLPGFSVRVGELVEI